MAFGGNVKDKIDYYEHKIKIKLSNLGTYFNRTGLDYEKNKIYIFRFIKDLKTVENQKNEIK
jgi:hypothetical protein